MEMKGKLPVGSVVLLKNSTKRLMVTGFLQANPAERENVFDYCGCLYPEGYQDGNHVYLFQEDMIEKVYAVGYMDEEQFAFAEKLSEIEQCLS
ncbi:MAG: DUF4176 domain-containing protein [Eubacteriales bacterium]|nr:DUF4176 domain-containing protein [Eubacteriales bacterium]